MELLEIQRSFLRFDCQLEVGYSGEEEGGV